MESIKKGLGIFFFLLLVIPSLFSQNELKFGDKKIYIPGNEICSYTINKNSHLTKCFLEVKNGYLLYTVIEYNQGQPSYVEITECKVEDLDKSSCSLGSSDQKSTYTPGSIYVIYLYTLKDQVSISTTVYGHPDSLANIEKSSVGRIHFRDLTAAQNFFDTYLK
jgi:hypothetical protein